MLPGPPTDIAIATPAILPSPRVPDKAVDSAWEWGILPGSSFKLYFPNTKFMA